MIGWRQSGFEFAAVKSGVRGVLQDITGTQRIAGSDLQILIIITIQGEIGAQPGRDVRLDTAFEGFERLGIDRERRHASHVEHTAFEAGAVGRSEEHTSELQSLMRISYAVFCLKKKNYDNKIQNQNSHIH